MIIKHVPALIGYTTYSPKDEVMKYMISYILKPRKHKRNHLLIDNYV